MSTITMETALALAREKLDHLSSDIGDHLAVVTEQTTELPKGWVFFYNTQDFIRTRDPLSALAGNGPLFVTRHGKLYVLPSSMPLQEAVERIDGR